MEEKANLCSIPPELLDHILDDIDEDPRSICDVYDQPSLSLISGRYKHPPLKSLSRVSRGFRQLLFPRVFRHTIQFVTADDRDAERQSHGMYRYPEWPVDKFQSFTDFIEEKQLNLIVRTFTLAIKAQPEFDECEYYCGQPNGPSVNYIIRWKHLLHRVIPMLGQVTIIAPPTVLGMLTSVSVSPASIKTLHIPYQIFSLWMHEIPTSIQPVNEETSKETNGRSLLTLFPWTGILLNEGSFLRSYIIPSSWENHMFMSDELVQDEELLNQISQIRTFCYIGLWAPQRHLRFVVQFAASLPNLEVFRFGLQTMAPLLDAPRETAFINQQIIADEMEESYPELMFMFSQAEELAAYLGVDSCFDHLYHVHCTDSPEVVGFDGEDEEVTSGWHWSYEDPSSHMLFKDSA